MSHAIGAVLTGDLVASRAAGAEAVAQSMAHLAQAADALSARLGHDLHFTRFRGDGWQLLVRDPAQALGATVWLLTCLRRDAAPVPTRIAVGIGTYEGDPAQDLGLASGTAFVAAGRALDAMSKLRRIVIAGDGVTPLHDAVFALAEHQIMGWTQPQAEAVALMLDGSVATQAAAAARLGITRQAVQIRLAGAGYNAIADAIAGFTADIAARTQTGVPR